VDGPLHNKLLALLPLEDLNSITGASSPGDVCPRRRCSEGRAQRHNDLLPAIGHAFAPGRAERRPHGRNLRRRLGRHGGCPRRTWQQTSRVRTVAQLPVHVLAIPADQFRTLVAASTVISELCLRNTDVLLDQTRITAACNSFHDVEARFCRWLLHTADRAESNQFVLKQELLSEMLGVRRTYVTNVASGLQKRGIISCSRGNMRFLNRRALQSLSCECYGLLKRNSS
jgi:Crp-like helix-turn-helix domain